MNAPCCARKPNCGFTMIELLIVIAIMAILMGLLFEAFSMIRQQAKRVQTKTLMGQLEAGLTDYLKTYPILGQTADALSSDFVASPWTFLGRNQLSANLVPFIPLDNKFLAIGNTSGPWTAASQTTGDQILDAYFTGDHSNHFIWSIFNGPASGPFTYTDKIYIRSTAGTPDNDNDDLISRFTLSDGNWTYLTYSQAEADVPQPW